MCADSNNVLRCSGRFSGSQVHPKLLPKDRQYTKLCIVRAHRRLLHAGVSHTLAHVRMEHWVIHGRSAVQKVIRQCLICLHWEGGPFKTPPFSNFPDYVLSANLPPFTSLGLDYLGPIVVKDEPRVTKNWICLFTCLDTKAIHLELIDDMKTHNFIQRLRRFFARRGTPSLMISDNASNFKLGNAVIYRIWKNVSRDIDVQSNVVDKGILWRFITDLAPWKWRGGGGGYFGSYG